MELQSMGFLEGMIYGTRRKSEGKGRVLDWDEAAEIVASTNDSVWAGLAEDWDYTSGLIGEKTKQLKSQEVYSASMWATPVVVIGDYRDGIVLECWKYATDEDSADMPDYWGE